MSRILIAGTGALGSVFGGLLRAGGNDVTLLGRDPHLSAVRRDGLRITGIWGEHFASGLACCTDASALRGNFDAILITVKSFDTASMAAATAPLLSPHGVMISLQNGLGNLELITAAAGYDRALGGRVIFGAELTAPGVVQVTVYADPVLIGAPALESARWSHLQERAKAWARLFDDCGIPSQPCDDIAAALWAKAFYNAALNPLGALLGLHYGALPQHEDSRSIMDRVIDECFTVATAEGVRLAWDSPDAYRQSFYEHLVPSTFHHRSSMLQDLERGRRTEIEAINGEVWRRGLKHRVPVPFNELLTRLVRARGAQNLAAERRRLQNQSE
jgi:2-dehydropantoate 2-reductase